MLLTISLGDKIVCFFRCIPCTTTTITKERRGGYIALLAELDKSRAQMLADRATLKDFKRKHGLGDDEVSEVRREQSVATESDFGVLPIRESTSSDSTKM